MKIGLNWFEENIIMNYYAPKQRVSDNLWDYTGNGHPVGYCKEYSDPDTWSTRKYMSDDEAAKYKSFKDKYHTHAHSTEEEACNCYKEYMLDHHLSLGHKDSSAQHRCKKCNEWTQGLAGVGAYSLWCLCEKCQTREVISEIYKVGESWES